MFEACPDDIWIVLDCNDGEDLGRDRRDRIADHVATTQHQPDNPVAQRAGQRSQSRSPSASRQWRGEYPVLATDGW